MHRFQDIKDYTWNQLREDIIKIKDLRLLDKNVLVMVISILDNLRRDNFMGMVFLFAHNRWNGFMANLKKVNYLKWLTQTIKSIRRMIFKYGHKVYVIFIKDIDKDG